MPYKLLPLIRTGRATLQNFFNRIARAAPLPVKYFPIGVCSEQQHSAEFYRELVTQPQLRVEFRITSQRDKLPFAQIKRAILECADAQQLKLLREDVMHAMAVAKLPLKVSRRTFALHLLMIVFHVAAASGKISRFWRAANQSIVFHALPDDAKRFLPEIARLAYMHRVSTNMTVSFVESIEWARISYETSKLRTMEESEQPEIEMENNAILP
eukprot:ANDGO_07241.mRNA.1 hypothetical protein